MHSRNDAIFLRNAASDKDAVCADQILGKGNKFSQLYSPGRSLGVLPVPPIKPEYVKNAVEVRTPPFLAVAWL